MNVETRDERWRRMLREADAADAASGLTMEEVREMRRAVLTAVPEPRRRFALFPLLAGASMAVLAAIAVLWLWPRSESPLPAPAPPRIAVEKARPDMKRTDGNTDVERMDMRSGLNAPRTKAVAAGLRARRPAASAPGVSPGEQIAASNEPETESRQIQFDTPGGTRVIWILTANNAL